MKQLLLTLGLMLHLVFAQTTITVQRAWTFEGADIPTQLTVEPEEKLEDNNDDITSLVTFIYERMDYDFLQKTPNFTVMQGNVPFFTAVLTTDNQRYLVYPQGYLKQINEEAENLKKREPDEQKMMEWMNKVSQLIAKASFLVLCHDEELTAQEEMKAQINNIDCKFVNLGLGFKSREIKHYTEEEMNKDLTTLYESALATNPAYPSPISRAITAKSCLKYEPVKEITEEEMKQMMMRDSLKSDSINKAVEALAKRAADSLAHVSYLMDKDEHGNKKKRKEEEAFDNRPDYEKKAEALKPTQVQWLEEEYDFKTIKEGDIVTHTFKVKNTGNKPLIITHVKPSCGCTATNWTKEAIPKGKEGSIEIKFDSNNRPGIVSKTISVYGNYKDIVHQLRFKGEVTPDPNKVNESEE